MPYQAHAATRLADRRLWLAVALAASLMAATGAPSDAPVSTGTPTVRQLASWADGETANLGGLAAMLRDSGASVVRRLPLVSAVVVEAPRSWQVPAGVRTTADRSLRVSGIDDHSGRAESARGRSRTRVIAESATMGSGVTVAVVDTGVAAVPDLAGAVQHINVSGAPAGDGFGHGTFLAGVIAGSGAASGGLYAGVAPRAGILDVQVAAADGSTSLFRVLAGLQAVADRARQDDSLRVVNLALSADDPGSPGPDPLSRAVEGLWARGLVVIVSAGNDGPAPSSVTVPGTDPAVITVGALDDMGSETTTDDVVAPFSSRGGSGEPTAKPDLLAPGVAIVGLRAPGSVIDTQFPMGRIGSDSFRGSGTSMSAAVTSGATADLLSALPDLDPDQVKQALMAGAYPVPGDSSATGAGGLDLAGATSAAQRISVDQLSWSSATVTATYARFAAAWQAGSAADARTAWLQLPLALRGEVVAAWATAVAADGRADATQAAAARAWATDGDLGSGWLSRSWASRSWAADDWASRSWASRSWASRSWASRSWATAEWGPSSP